jgi:hypothetical protein
MYLMYHTSSTQSKGVRLPRTVSARSATGRKFPFWENGGRSALTEPVSTSAWNRVQNRNNLRNGEAVGELSASDLNPGATCAWFVSRSLTFIVMDAIRVNGPPSKTLYTLYNVSKRPRTIRPASRMTRDRCASAPPFTAGAGFNVC